MDKLSWRDVEDIALALCAQYPKRDPLSVRFTELRALVEALDEFHEEPGHPVNEAILEAIQAAWIEERQGADPDADEPRYRPADPFRPRSAS